MSNSSNNNIKYVYNLPYFARKDLCRLLDQMEMWEELAGKYMEFDMMTIQDLRREERRGASPTDELLTIWGHKNHTVLELFALLSKMQHYQAMLILKPFVPEEYHRLIEYGEERLPPLLGELKSSRVDNAGAASRSDTKDLDIDSRNLNRSVTDNLLQSKINFPETKILNMPGEAGTNENKENVVPRSNALGVPQENVDVNQQRKLSNASDISSVAENCGSIPHIEYHELVAATNNWSKHNIVGKGGFGTVFKGDWRNTQVAVKRIEQRGAESARSNQVQLEQSLRELHVLNSFRHDNILPLYGYSLGGEEPCLVYQFMCNGSLEDRLLCRQGTEPLTWHQRHEIAKGSARGLQFLHNSKKGYIHGDIKSANILLDVNFIPRIGDFGLAREGPQNNYTHLKVSRVHGTRPYLPDEFLRGKQISTKVDTYSFGIVLFELGTGLRAYDDARPYKLLKEHVENCELENLERLIDNKIAKDAVIFYHLMSLGMKCVSKNHRHRPEMEMVLKELEQPVQCFSPRGSNCASRVVQSPASLLHVSNTPFLRISNTDNRIPGLPSCSPQQVETPLQSMQPALEANSSIDIPNLDTERSVAGTAADLNESSLCPLPYVPDVLPDLSILGIRDLPSPLSTAETKHLDL